jgi:hypothetical protein
MPRTHLNPYAIDKIYRDLFKGNNSPRNSNVSAPDRSVCSDHATAFNENRSNEASEAFEEELEIFKEKADQETSDYVRICQLLFILGIKKIDKLKEALNELHQF